MTDSNSYLLALCQFAPQKDKGANWDKAVRDVSRAAEVGAHIVAMPEMWNCPYGNKFFSEYAEEDGGESFLLMSELAKKNSVYLVGGSIPEHADGKYYNTSYIFGADGSLIGKHRKVHLFDVDITGGMSFHESDTLSAGTEITVVDTDFGKVGVAICFDIRFCEMFKEMATRGCHLVILPASFAMDTGAVHWDLLIRSRALDNQFYLAACASARGEKGFISWAHSMIADPWGDIRAAASVEETVIFGQIDLGYMERIRAEMPL